MFSKLNLGQIGLPKNEGKPIDINIIKQVVYGHLKTMLPMSLSVLTFSYTFPTSYHKSIVLIDFLL